jgi:hypothetical protein
MSKIRVLLAGKSWSSTTTHTKGFGQFSTAEFKRHRPALTAVGLHRVEGYRRPWLNVCSVGGLQSVAGSVSAGRNHGTANTHNKIVNARMIATSALISGAKPSASSPTGGSARCCPCR